MLLEVVQAKATGHIDRVFFVVEERDARVRTRNEPPDFLAVLGQSSGLERIAGNREEGILREGPVHVARKVEAVGCERQNGRRGCAKIVVLGHAASDVRMDDVGGRSYGDTVPEVAGDRQTTRLLG